MRDPHTSELRSYHHEFRLQIGFGSKDAFGKWRQVWQGAIFVVFTGRSDLPMPSKTFCDDRPCGHWRHPRRVAEQGFPRPLTQGVAKDETKKVTGT
ncbi:hypothetical protein ACOI1H_18770 [Loktanella sp. DJP18]|uniref:hypothetical protein n=1 Tax=Loktanella sp. DJP18 TaxID=3409788 RepID=UPI003BB58F9F